MDQEIERKHLTQRSHVKNQVSVIMTDRPIRAFRWT